MRQLRPLYRVLLAVLLPLWAVCMVLHLQVSVSGRMPALTLLEPWVVSDGGEAYPVVRGFRPGARVWTEHLAVGDRLLRVGEADLRGVGAVGLLARVLEQAGPDFRAHITFERAGERRTVELPIEREPYPWRFLLASIGFAAVGVLLLLRAPDSGAIRAWFLAGVWYSILWLPFPGGPPVQTYAWVALRCLAGALSYPLFLRAILLFPDEAAARSSLGRNWPWVFALLGPSWTSLSFGIPVPQEIGMHVNPALGLTHNVLLLVVLTRNYRLSGPLGRRQLRWVVYGLYLGLAPVVASLAIVAIAPQLWWLYSVLWNSLGLIPVFLFIAIVRYNLGDVDRLISATASYTVLSIVLLAGLLAVVPRLSQATSAATGIDPSSGQLILSFGLAAVVIPAQRYLRPLIERIFFSERHALAQGVERVLSDLASCAGPRELVTLAGERLDALLRPETCVIYAAGSGLYSPVFVRGRAVPPAFEASSPLIVHLEQRTTLLSLDAAARRQATDFSPFDRAALEALGAVVLIPVKRRGALTAFVCLGAKRSGDVYTTLDLALLGAIAEKASSELMRVDDDELIQQGRAMQEALRRYVPGAIADQLASGQDPESGEREVTVLFVDIRGYTTYAEGRKASEVFFTVNRYTETVSRVVREHGGAIVEFNGDGMMAVFGAPSALERKERAAARAARALVAEVGALSLPDAENDASTIAVGVGVATGDAFVGNIRSVDRLIWTAIGNTTNLAARLQALTRELDASIVIDSLTWKRAEGAAEGFSLSANTPIRGRQRAEDVYLLPLEPALGSRA